MADGYKAELEASKQRVEELEGAVEAASSDSLAMQELQAMADGYKAELEASKQRVEELERELSRMQESIEAASSDSQALQEAQATAEGYKADLEASKRQLEAVEAQLQQTRHDFQEQEAQHAVAVQVQTADVAWWGGATSSLSMARRVGELLNIICI